MKITSGITVGLILAALLAAGAIWQELAQATSSSTKGKGPIEVTDCGVLDSSSTYVLTGNLSAAGDCLVVGADDMTIDLNGFTITGDGETGFGITNNGINRENIVVRDGTVREFLAGVLLFPGEGLVVERVRAEHNVSTGIEVSGPSIVKDNFARANGAAGIFVWGVSTVTGNVAALNGEDGISMVDAGGSAGDNGSRGSTVSGNLAYDNNLDGIVARLGSTVSGNSARNNGTAGIVVFCPSNVFDNAASGHTAGAQLVLQDGGCNLHNNLVAD